MVLTNANQTYNYKMLFPVALILGVVVLAIFWFMIKTTVFRIKTNTTVSEVKFNLLGSIGNFMKNGPVLSATLIPVSMFLGQYGAATCTSVVFRSYFGAGQLSGIMQMIGMLPMLLFVPFAKPMTEKFGKKEASSFCAIFSVISCILMNVIPMAPSMTGVLIYFALSFVHSVGLGCGMMLSSAMMADAIDYNEWKFGKRDESITYAVHPFLPQAGTGC